MEFCHLANLNKMGQGATLCSTSQKNKIKKENTLKIATVFYHITCMHPSGVERWAHKIFKMHAFVQLQQIYTELTVTTKLACFMCAHAASIFVLCVLFLFNFFTCAQTLKKIPPLCAGFAKKKPRATEEGIIALKPTHTCVFWWPIMAAFRTQIHSDWYYRLREFTRIDYSKTNSLIVACLFPLDIKIDFWISYHRYSGLKLNL